MPVQRSFCDSHRRLSIDVANGNKFTWRVTADIHDDGIKRYRLRHIIDCLQENHNRLIHSISWKHTHTRLTALFPGLPAWAGTIKVKPIWILLKQETVSGSGISWAVCKSASRSRQITMSVPHHSSFLQAGCPSCHPTNSIKAQKAVTEKRDKIETHNAYETTAFYCNRDILPQTTHLNIFTGLHYSAAFIFLCKHLAHYNYFQLNFPSPAHVRHKIANHFHLAVCFTHIWQLSQCFITHQINSCFVQTIWALQF